MSLRVLAPVLFRDFLLLALTRKLTTSAPVVPRRMHPWLTEANSRWAERVSFQSQQHLPLDSPRQLSSLTAECKGFSAFETPFNDDIKVKPYFGLMFSLNTFDQPFDITTLELDLRDDMPLEDRSVMVYMYPGSFETVEYSSSGWSLVANATVQPLTDLTSGEITSYIIPASSFTSFRVGARTRVSLYVSMNGPYLDNTVYALDKTGEVAFTGEHFSVNTGAGFSAPNFPSQGIDQTTEPKFTGIIHYKLDSTCDAGNKSGEEMTSTTVEFHFMVNQITSEDIASAVAQGLDSTLSAVLQSDVDLQHYRTLYGLAIVEGSANAVPAESQNEVLPCAVETWTACSVLVGRLTMAHRIGLNEGELIYQIYNLTGRVMDAISSTSLTPETKIIYIGYKSFAIDFSLTMDSVPSGQVMNEVQTKFVSAVLRSYLNSSLSTDSEILAVNMEEPNPTQRSKSPLLLSKSEKMTGKLYGIQRSFMEGTKFIDALNEVLVEDNGNLVAMFQQQLMIPGPVNQGSAFEYFRNVTSLNLQFFKPTDSNDDDYPVIAGSVGIDSRARSVDEENKVKIIGTVMGVAGGVLVLLLTAGAVCYYYFSSRSDAESKYGKYSDTEEEEASLPTDEEMQNIALCTGPGTRKAPVKSASFSSTIHASPRAPPLRSKSTEGAILYKPSNFRKPHSPQRVRLSSGEERIGDAKAVKTSDFPQPASAAQSRQLPRRSQSYGGMPRSNLVGNPMTRSNSSRNAVMSRSTPKTAARPKLRARSSSSDVMQKPPARSSSNGSLCGGVVSQAPLPRSSPIGISLSPPSARDVSRADSACTLSTYFPDRAATPDCSLPGYLHEHPRATSTRSSSGARSCHLPTKQSWDESNRELGDIPLRRAPSRSVSFSPQARQVVQEILREGRSLNGPSSRQGVLRSRSEPLSTILAPKSST